MGRQKPDVNVTFRLDPDIVFWARVRAFTHGTSLNAVLKRFLAVYAAVPEPWWQRQPPPWSPDGRSEAGWAIGQALPDGLEGEDRLGGQAAEPGEGFDAGSR